jgi:RNA polymerase sigma-70 factor (ECF subfamily)
VNPLATSVPNPALLVARMEQAAPPSPELLRLTTALARGDDVAWSQFHREYGPAIFRQLLAATRGDHDLASEALQQTYLRVARHARPCESEAMFWGWLRLVARTALSDCRRRRRSFWDMLRRRAGEPDVDPDTSAHEDQRLQAAIDMALARVDAADQALLTAKYFRNESVREMAERLGVSPKAVESRLTRARAQLRSELSKLLSRDE